MLHRHCALLLVVMRTAVRYVLLFLLVSFIVILVIAVIHRGKPHVLPGRVVDMINRVKDSARILEATQGNRGENSYSRTKSLPNTSEMQQDVTYPADVFSSIENDTHICHYDAFNTTTGLICRCKCPAGQFSLPGLAGCHPYLRCRDLGQIQILDEFCEKTSDLKCRSHFVKQLFKATWQGQPVVLANLSIGWHGLGENWDHAAHHLFLRGQTRLRELQGNHTHVINYLGGCKGRWLVTELYKYGGLADVEGLLNTTSHDSLETRFHLCLSYASVLRFLKHSPAGPLVMADSDSTMRALSQFVVSDNLNVVLADVDLLPEATNGTLCRAVELRPFTAPEQNCTGNATHPHGTDLAKTDSWKFPFICRKLLNNQHRYKPRLHDSLLRLFSQCLQEDPDLRPDADEIFTVLKNISLQEFDRLI